MGVRVSFNSSLCGALILVDVTEYPGTRASTNHSPSPRPLSVENRPERSTVVTWTTGSASAELARLVTLTRAFGLVMTSPPGPTKRPASVGAQDVMARLSPSTIRLNPGRTRSRSCFPESIRVVSRLFLEASQMRFPAEHRPNAASWRDAPKRL